MEKVVLIVHLILALSLIATVLLQRSEGGGLGMGGGGASTGRAGATALGKVTWVIAIAFIITSIALTIIAAEKSSGASVTDGETTTPVIDETAPATPGLGEGSLLPPAATDSGPVVPEAN